MERMRYVIQSAGSRSPVAGPKAFEECSQAWSAELQNCSNRWTSPTDPGPVLGEGALARNGAEETTFSLSSRRFTIMRPPRFFLSADLVLFPWFGCIHLSALPSLPLFHPTTCMAPQIYVTTFSG